jgi:localization factor PodJL
MTLSEWLDDAIAERAARLRISADQMDEEHQVAAIAMRLGALPIDDLPPRRTATLPDGELPIRGRQANMRLLDAAVAHLGLQADRSAPLRQDLQRKGFHKTDDVVNVAHHIAELDEALGRCRAGPRPAALLTPVESRLRRIAESLLSDTPDADGEELRRMEARLEQFAVQLDQAPPAHRRRPEPARDELGQIRSQIEDLLRAVALIGERTPRARAEPALHDLLSRIEASRAEGVSDAALSPILHALVDLRAALEQTPAATVRALGDELAAMRHRLASLERSNDGVAIAAMRQKIELLARHLADLVVRLSGRECANDSLHDQIAQLADRVEEIAETPRRLSETLVGVIDDLRTSIERIDTSPGFLMMERRIEDLAARQAQLTPDMSRTLVDLRETIDSLGEHPAVLALQSQLAELAQVTVAMPRSLLESLDDLRRVIETMAASPALSADLRGTPLPGHVVESLSEIRLSLEKLAANAGVRLADDQSQRLQNIELHVADISEKLATPPLIARIAGLQDSVLARIDSLRSEWPGEHLTALRSRMEDVHRAVSQPSLPQDLPPPGYLDDIVSRLSAKLERVASVGAQDPRALQAIENQVLRIAERLDRHGEASEAISTLERSLGDLLVKVDETPSLDAGLGQTIARDLSTLREWQDETDRRTRTTLEAVHETLEKVVDRLALLESDVGGLRASPRAPNQEVSAETPVAETPLAASPVAAPPEPEATRPAPGPQVPVIVDPAPALMVERADTPRPAKPVRDDESLDMALEMSEPRAAQRSFIAAARRATRLMGGAPPPPTRISLEHPSVTQDAVTPGDPPPGDSSRKIMLGVAGLVLTMGAFHWIGDDRPSLPSKSRPHVTATAAVTSQIAINPEHTGGPDAASGSFDTLPVASMAGPESTLGILRDLAINGHPAAQFELATRLAEGRGVGRDAPQAARWLEKAAQQNYAPAQYRLAALYEKGAGVERSTKDAIRWYASAADAGHVRAMHNLGVLLADGVDAKPDYVAAAALFRRAAEYGLRDSQFNLAVLYLRGLGVSTNLVEAYKFFALAAAQGDADALNRREDVAARMVPKQVNEARRAVEKFALRTPEPAANEPPAFEAIVGHTRASLAVDSSDTASRSKADTRIISLQ